MAIRWFDGFKDFNKADMLQRLNIAQDGTLTVDGNPVQNGTGGGSDMTLTVEDYFSGSANVTKTYTKSMMGFDIANDGSSDLTFTINGLTLTVKAGEVFSDVFEPFTAVTVTSTVAFRAYVKAQYTSVVSPPTISPAGGLFNASQTITLSDSSVLSIYYTLDGSIPTTSSTKYTSPFTISSTTTIKFIGVDANGNVSVVQTATYTIDTTAPNDVTGLTVGTVTSSSIPLTWTLSTSTDVANYEISYSTNSGSTWTVASNAVNSSSTSYTISGLSASTNYEVRVVAIDNAGNRSTGATATTTTSAAPASPAPSDVTGLAASSVTSSSLTLSWTAGANDASYDVYNGSTLLGNTTNTTYNVTGLTASTSYTFKVVAKNSSGVASTGVTLTQSTTAAPDTTPPTITISPAAGTYTSTQSVTLTGTDNSGGAVTIYYTTDGSTPTTSSNVYSSPISVSATTTIKYYGVDSAGNASAVQSSTYTIQTAPNYLPNAVVYDSFNRSDNSASLGTTDSGHTWVADSQVWGISGNKARPYSGTADRDVYIESGKSDCSIQVTFASAIGSTATAAHRLMFRWNASGQCFVLQATTTGYTLYMQNGAWSSIGTSSGVTPAQGDVVKVVLSGSSITCFVNGTQIISVTNTNYQTATKHGLAIGNASTTTIAFDDFSIA